MQLSKLEREGGKGFNALTSVNNSFQFCLITQYYTGVLLVTVHYMLGKNFELNREGDGNCNKLAKHNGVEYALK